jgi:hypothetical protein
MIDDDDRDDLVAVIPVRMDGRHFPLKKGPPGEDDGTPTPERLRDTPTAATPRRRARRPRLPQGGGKP